VRRSGYLRRGKPKAGAVPKRTAALPRASRKRKPARDTGPSPAVRRIVHVREGMACAACGISVTGRPHSIQHRRARGMGGTTDPAANLPSNLVLLCGTAVTGCHGLAESRDPDMHGRGFWLRSWENPAVIPVMIASERNSGLTVWLDDSGEYAFAPPGEAAA
jgi:hypothetical protein